MGCSVGCTVTEVMVGSDNLEQGLGFRGLWFRV